jgi:hypothetical protein
VPAGAADGWARQTSGTCCKPSDAAVGL